MRSSQVWVTGLGAVTAAGVGVPSLLSMIVEQENRGLGSESRLGGFPVGRAPDPPRSRAGRHLDRSANFFLAAAEEAWVQAGLDDGAIHTDRCSVIEGSALGPMAELLETYRERMDDTGGRVRPSGVIRFMTGAGGAAFAQVHGITGSVSHLSVGCVSALCAIGEAFQQITAGRVDVAVVGAAECPLHEEIINNFRAAGVLAERNGRPATCRPFDAHRSGIVLGEGAGVLILEAEDHARRRGASPFGAIAGFGFTSEAYSMTTPSPDGTGVARAARQALNGSAIRSLDWIKVHGTGTKLNDAAECRGLADLLGPKLCEVPLTSFKPMVGHCLGASGAVEGVMALLALEQSLIPPTLGFEELDPSLPNCSVQQRLGECDAKAILLLAESFGGRCAALVLKKA